MHESMKALVFVVSLALALPAFADYNLANDYSVAWGGTALLIADDGVVVFEDYQDNPDDPVFIASGAKTFTGYAALAAVTDGYIRLRSELWFPNERGQRATLLQALRLTSGWQPDARHLGAPCLLIDRCVPSYREHVENFLQYHASAFDARPGRRFEYDPIHFNVYGFAISDRIGEHLIDWAYVRLFGPAGVFIPRWDTDEVGDKRFSSGAWVTARQWYAWAQFMASDGNGLISPYLMALARQPSNVNPGYGASVWLNKPGGVGPNPDDVSPPGSVGGWIYHGGYPDIFMAAGNGDNFAMVLPSLNLIVVRLCRGSEPGGSMSCASDFVYDEFVSMLLR
jgi:CubicO group peptidase (beta-lactamase class C family)